MEALNKIMQDITLTENGNFRFRLPKTIGTVKCPVCGANSDIVEYWHPPTKTYKKLDWIESDGKCFECVKHDEAMEEFERQREEARIARIERIKKVFDEDSLMNPKLKAATFENYNPTNNDLEKAKVITKRYADHFSKENPISLLLIGNYGTGKSHLSVAITKELMDKNLSCIFISTPKLMTKIRSTYNKESDYTEEQILDQLSKVDCLVLDDIGAESVKQGDSNQHTWATSKIFEIIDNRIGKHTIFTTNYDVNELQQRLGGRNFSRMMESVHVIKMYGDDYRLKDFK